MPAGELDDLRVTGDLACPAVVRAIVLGGLDQAGSQRASAPECLDHPVLVGIRVLACALFARPALAETLAEHRLVRLGAVGAHFVPLSSVVRVAGIADRRDSAVSVLDRLREMAAPAVDPDPAVR